MSAFADASFLVASFISTDDHNRSAWSWWKNRNVGIVTTSLALFEAENTIRGLPVGGRCSSADAQRALEGMKRVGLEGIVEVHDIPLRRWLPLARRLSQYYTTDATFGALDIIHVAAARILELPVFVSFDLRQRELAKAEGLTVGP